MITKKPRMMTYGSREYRRLSDDLVYGWAPEVYPCVHCGGPVLDGHCCERCGSADPRTRRTQEVAK